MKLMKLKNVLSSALLLAAVILIGSKSALAVGAQQPMIGQPAPPIALKTVDGKQVDLSELRGKIVVIHFAASW